MMALPDSKIGYTLIKDNILIDNIHKFKQSLRN